MRLKKYIDFKMEIVEEMNIDLDSATEEEKNDLRKRVYIAWTYYQMGAIDAYDDVKTLTPDIRQFFMYQNLIARKI